MQTRRPTTTPDKGNDRLKWSTPRLTVFDIAEITRGGTSSGPDAPCNQGFDPGAC